ncbi:MAG: AGZA family xanthine/uracil permease-like MFS transporter [Spirosomataceae bacterium]|jgi:AGZA family xanthine/uracil permease-like MFS transporter
MIKKPELIAGTSSFLACAYIVIVNPAILSQAGMPFAAVVTSTVLVSAFGSIMMGLYAKNPIIIAPGMGMNAFFTFTAVSYIGLTYQEALGAVFWAGVLFLILSVFNIREAIVKAIPVPIRHAVAAGIGLFIGFIGFQNAHFIVDNPATLVGLASLKDPVNITFLIGLLITAVLVARNTIGGILIGIIITTLLAYPIGRFWGDASAVNFGTATLVNYTGFFAMPDFSLLFAADIFGGLRFAFLPVIFVFAFTDLFDSLSTFVGIAEAADLKDENGEPKNLKKSLITDAMATLSAGLFGSSPGTAFVESAVGISQGGRTGATAVVAGLLFLPLMFFSPLLSLIPTIASSVALVLVGAFMLSPIVKINWKDVGEAIPCFLAIALIPFTYSITQGIIFGLLSWTIIKLFTGKQKELHPVLIIINLLSLITFFL